VSEERRRRRQPAIAAPAGVEPLMASLALSPPSADRSPLAVMTACLGADQLSR
jgi:hypothetical protein